MASSTLQKLLRAPARPVSTILTHLRKPLPPLPLTQAPQIPFPIDPVLERDCFKSNRSCAAQFYPGFSFEFFLNPNCPPSLIRSEADGETISDDSNVVRADSVKKKRKKKMNKHKLKKLRKRERRKT